MTTLHQHPVATSLRRDHRLSLRIIELRFANAASEIDAFAVARITYYNAVPESSVSVPQSPTSNDPPPNLFRNADQLGVATHHGLAGLRKMSLLPAATQAHTATSKRYTPPHSSVLLGKTVPFKTKDSAFIDHNFDADLTSDVHHIEVELYQKRMLKDSLLGTAIISADQLLTSKPVERWFPIKSSHTSSSPPSPTVDLDATLLRGDPPEPVPVKPAEIDGSTGVSLRIRLTYWNEYLLPLTVYKPLVAVLMDPKMSVVSCLERSVEQDRDDVARTLVSVMHSMDMHEPLLIGMATREIHATSSPALLFRANSVASKALDQFMKLVGRPMLDSVLRPVIKSIMAENRSCELDASRIDRSHSSSSIHLSQVHVMGSSASLATERPTKSLDQVLTDHQSALEGYIQWTIDRIIAGANECPITLRNVFTAMRAAASIKWPHELEVSYVVVSSFLFLRMFNAAILGPKLFGLCDTFPNPTVARTLTLLSKSLQQVANGCVFDGAKEPYMTPLNPLLESLFPKVRNYLELMSTPVNPVSPRKSSVSTIPNPVTSSTISLASTYDSISLSSSFSVPPTTPFAKASNSAMVSRKGLVKKLFGSSSIQTKEPPNSGLGSHYVDVTPVRDNSSSRVLLNPGSEPIKHKDIERDFADLYRILTRIIGTMQSKASPSETSSVNRLAIILKDLSTIKERRMASTPSAALIDAISQAREVNSMGSRRLTMMPSIPSLRRQSVAVNEHKPWSPPALRSPTSIHLPTKAATTTHYVPTTTESAEHVFPSGNMTTSPTSSHQCLNGYHHSQIFNGLSFNLDLFTNGDAVQRTYTPSIIGVSSDHGRRLVPSPAHKLSDTP